MALDNNFQQLGPDVLNFPDKFNVNEGKFVRIGSLVATSPYSERISDLHCSHTGLMYFAKKLVSSPKHEDEEPVLTDPDMKETLLNDAGYFYVYSAEEFRKLHEDEESSEIDLSLPVVVVTDRSEAYGSAPLEGRDCSGEIFSEALGGLAVVHAYFTP